MAANAKIGDELKSEDSYNNMFIIINEVFGSLGTSIRLKGTHETINEWLQCSIRCRLATACWFQTLWRWTISWIYSVPVLGRPCHFSVSICKYSRGENLVAGRSGHICLGDTGDVEAESGSGGNASSRHHGFVYSEGLVLVTAVPPVNGTFLAIDVLYSQHGRQALLESCWVGVIDDILSWNVIGSLEEPEVRAMLWGNNQIFESYIGEWGDPVISLHETIMVSRLLSSLLFILYCDSSCTNIVQSVLGYAKMCDLEYNVCFLRAQRKDISRDLDASNLIQHANLTNYMYNTHIELILLEVLTQNRHHAAEPA